MTPTNTHAETVRAFAAQLAADQFHPIGYLLEIRPYSCQCGATWHHSELYQLLAAPNSNQPQLRRRRELTASHTIDLELPRGTSTLQPKSTLVCHNCLETPKLPTATFSNPHRSGALLNGAYNPEFERQLYHGARAPKTHKPSTPKSIPTIEEL